MNKKDTSKPRGWLGSLIKAIITFGSAGVFFYFAYLGIKTGTIALTSTKETSSPGYSSTSGGFYTRGKDSWDFWVDEIICLGSGLSFTIWGVCDLRKEYKRRQHQKLLTKPEASVNQSNSF